MMSASQFNALQLNAGDKIEIAFDNETTGRYLLYNGTATKGVSEKIAYLTKEIVPAIPSKIVVQDKASGAEMGLLLSTIERIVRIEEI